VDALCALILRAQQLSLFLPPLSAAIAVRDAKIEKQVRKQVRVEIWKMNRWIRGEILNVSTLPMNPKFMVQMLIIEVGVWRLLGGHTSQSSLRPQFRSRFSLRFRALSKMIRNTSSLLPTGKV
jgi:hypothetical protein